MTESVAYINRLPIPGKDIPIIPGLDDHYFTILLMMLLDWLIVYILFTLGSVKPSIKPKKTQNLMEWAVRYITDTADAIIGPEAPRFYSFLVTFFFYILIGNLMGLVPGLISPTSSLSVTAALAVMVFISEWVVGIMKNGPVKFIMHFAGSKEIPLPIRFILFPIELLSDISRPLSLSFRLFGNIMAKEILLGVLVSLILLFWPAISKDAVSAGLFGIAGVLRPLIVWLGALVSLIQAGVFTLLTATYLAGVVASHGHDEAHAENH